MLTSAMLVVLAGCQGTAPTTTTTTNTVSAGGVDRVSAPSPTPTSTPSVAAQATIQTQPGPGGASAALNKVAVTGDVLTVQLTVTSPKGTLLTLPLDQISLIDDKTSQRIGMLKDNEGRWLASPLNGDGKNLSVNLYESPVVVWMKFPAPAATSPTVSLNIPEIAPFDGVPVTR